MLHWGLSHRLLNVLQVADHCLCRTLKAKQVHGFATYTLPTGAKYEGESGPWLL